MKTLFTLVCAVCFAASLSAAPALSPLKTETAFRHLSEVNKQWLKHAADAPHENISFNTDIDRIRYHLLNVEQFLRSNTPKGLTQKGLIARPRLLDALHLYANAKSFPTNSYHNERTPYFIDNFNVYCAVGHLISVSGHDELAQRINLDHRFDYIHHIKTNGLVEWAGAHGFTVDELAWIQPAYSPATAFAPLQAGTDGPVTTMVTDITGNNIVFAGEFNNVNNMPCMNIGRYENNQLSCFGDGISGAVNDVLVAQGSVMVAGDIGSTGMNAPLAVFNTSTSQWSYEQIPQSPGAVGHVVFYGGLGYTKELVISQPSNPNQHELWYQQTNGTWEKKATFNGKINDAEGTAMGRVYAGQFDQVIAHKSTGDETVTAHNAVIFDMWNDVWSGIGTALPNEILVVRNISEALYIGGTCGDGQSEICLTRYLNGALQPLLLKNMFSDSVSSTINAIEWDNTQLIIGGAFQMDQMMWYGRHLAYYDLVNNYLLPIALLDAGVNGVTQLQDNWYFGGDFTQDMTSGQMLSHLARIDESTSAQPVDGDAAILIYPNPASDVVTILHQGVFAIQITDMTGRVVLELKPTQSDRETLDVSNFANGMYMIVTESAKGRSAVKLQVYR